MRVIVDELGDHPRWSALVWCPTCGQVMSLMNHTIGADGSVTPSIGHPSGAPACAWHPNARLLGWDRHPPEISPLPKHRCEKCGKESRAIGGWGVGWGYSLICKECIDLYTAESVIDCVSDTYHPPAAELEKP